MCKAKDLTKESLWRGKTWQTDEWVYGHLLQAPGVYTKIVNYRIAYGNVYEEYHRINSMTACRYRGMDDIDGNKIFTGDVLECTYFTTKDTLPANITGSLVPHTVRHVVTDTIASDVIVDKYRKFCRVIGNIYDNPELIKVINEEPVMLVPSIDAYEISKKMRFDTNE